MKLKSVIMGRRGARWHKVTFTLELSISWLLKGLTTKQKYANAYCIIALWKLSEY